MPETISAKDYNAMMATPKPSKYRNKKTVLDGITFDSQAELRRYGELKLLRDAGEIRDLECHPKFDLIQNGTKVGTYSADFRYVNGAGETVIEDVKSPPTRKKEAYRLKKKLVEAQYGIEIVEVEA